MISVSFQHRFPGMKLDIAFQAPAGLTVLFGRSGSGKTTIINTVAGLLRPDAGRIVAGESVLFDAAARVFLPPHKRRIGYVFQDARLFPHLTVRQNLLYGQWFAKSTGAGELGRIVEMLGLEALLHRRPATLSGGEKSRVALGRAILSRPRLLAMDEPLAALDEARKAEILPYLERVRDEGSLPILYVSHSMPEVARLASTLILVEGGKVRAAGPAAEILADPALAPGFGLREAGALLTGRVRAHDADGLTRIDCSAGPLWLPRLATPTGAEVRVRILAQDVMIAVQKPEAISALNIVPAVVSDIKVGEGPGALVRLQAGEDYLLARVTRRSIANLGLGPGKPVYAVLKAVSVAQENIGGINRPG